MSEPTDPIAQAARQLAVQAFPESPERASRAVALADKIVNLLRVERTEGRPPEATELQVQSYQLESDDPLKVVGIPATLERRRQRDGPALWAVCKMGRVLNLGGEWEWEPQPSSRDEAFIKRTRFNTIAAAVAAWDQNPDGWR